MRSHKGEVIWEVVAWISACGIFTWQSFKPPKLSLELGKDFALSPIRISNLPSSDTCYTPSLPPSSQNTSKLELRGLRYFPVKSGIDLPRPTQDTLCPPWAIILLNVLPCVSALSMKRVQSLWTTLAALDFIIINLDDFIIKTAPGQTAIPQNMMGFSIWKVPQISSTSGGLARAPQICRNLQWLTLHYSSKRKSAATDAAMVIHSYFDTFN